LCRSGTEALAIADRVKPHLALLDVMMPGLDGYSTAQRLKLLPGLKNLAIVFLTAKSGPMDVVKGIQSGARFYVSKPFKMDELLAKVRKALGEGAGRARTGPSRRAPPPPVGRPPPAAPAR